MTAKPLIRKQGNMYRCTLPTDPPRAPGKIPWAFGYGKLPATAYRNYDLRCYGFNGESDPYLVAIHVDRMRYCNAGAMVFKRAMVRVVTQLETKVHIRRHAHKRRLQRVIAFGPYDAFGNLR